MKINNLIVAHWLNVLCKRDYVTDGMIAAISCRCSPALSHTGVYQPGKLVAE